MRFGVAVAGLLMLTAGMGRGAAQSPETAADAAAQGAITVRSTLVLVPTFVKTKKGENVFALTADDFEVLDNGVAQKTRLEQDTDSQPLALAVVVETGGQGAEHLEDYRGLDATLESIVGGVEHRVAVVSFDSEAHLEQEFKPDTEKAAATIGGLSAGDKGAAILDGLRFATAELAKQPARYRRAVLLISETRDTASQGSLDETLRAIDSTNTAIYTFAFSSTKAALRHEGSKLPNPFGTTKYSSTPYKEGGCMSREAGADPDAHGSRAVQALDCASDLLPPLRLARMAYLAAADGMQKNVPETVAKLTGGEYFGFKDGKTLRKGLVGIANDVPNHYVLSFQPSAPTPGLHALGVRLKERADLVVVARDAYWVEGGGKP